VISHITGRLLAREVDRVEIATDAGLAYELHIPLAVYEKLPSMGDIVSLHTHLVVKEDGWQLFGFGSSFEREVFRGTLEAKGVGPGLALGMLSALGAANLVRAIKDRNVALLITAPRVGKKKAEQIVLDLAERFEELSARNGDATGARERGSGADDAVRALVSLGYSNAESERAVRAALDGVSGDAATAEIIRKALAVAGGSAKK
jgi:Holliday junction DNA helicase RuvA